MQRRKPGAGRPSKGDRWLVYTRLPRDLADLFRAEADRSELTYTDLLANITAAYYGRPAVQQPLAVLEDDLRLTA